MRIFPRRNAHRFLHGFVRGHSLVATGCDPDTQALRAHTGQRKNVWLPAAGKRPRPGILFALETPAMPGLLHLALCAPDEVPAVLRPLRGPASPSPLD